MEMGEHQMSSVRRPSRSIKGTATMSMKMLTTLIGVSTQTLFNIARKNDNSLGCHGSVKRVGKTSHIVEVA